MAKQPTLPVKKSDFDFTTKPTEDFFQFANGGWLKRAKIPKTESKWGVDELLRQKNYADLRRLLERTAAKRHPTGSNGQKIKDYYLTGMDMGARNREGLEGIRAELEMITAISHHRQLLSVIAKLHVIGCNPLWGIYVGQDDKDSNTIAFYLHQSGLGLPDRDYYFKTDARSKRIRQRYKTHIAKIFALSGQGAGAGRRAEAAIALEKKLAAASMTRVELRDVEAQYHKMSVTKLARLGVHIDWPAYFKSIGVPHPLKTVIVAQPKFIKEADRLLARAPIDDWKAYLTWKLLQESAPYMGTRFVRQHFEFYGKTLTGAKQMKPLWKRVLAEIDHGLGEALGKLYVKQHFPPDAKREMRALVGNLIAAYRERIWRLDWMSAPTKKKALEKLGKTVCKIGYPDVWRSYHGLRIQSDSYLRNHFRAQRFELARLITKLGKPVDRREWLMTPPTINAYNHFNMNEIVFPAGILQPPFFVLGSDDAFNYGGIGAVIGHELTHGFDDQGSLFDKDGNLKNWWQKRDRQKFNAKARRLVQQFDETVVIDNLHCNGKLTLGENIADLGGLIIAYKAFLKATIHKPRRTIMGFTPAQRFFIAHALTWRAKLRDELVKQRLITDFHAPGKLRTNIPLSNMTEFHEAFGAKKGDAMHRPPGQRAEIW